MRAQSSFELLIVFGMAMVVLAVLFFNAQEQSNTSQSAYAFSVASKSVNDLAKAADAVYFEGVGAKKKVLVTIPEETISTSVTASQIKITIKQSSGLTSDAAAYVSHPICGSSALNSTPGTYEIYVTAISEGCVLIGQATGLTVDPSLLYYAELSNTSSRTVYRNLTYTNLDAASIDVSVNAYWLAADSSYVNVSLNDSADSSFTLANGASRNVTLNITLYGNALGTYSGNVTANASNDDIVTTDVVIEVTSGTCTTASCATASNVSLILIDFYKNSTYGPQKYIFAPSINATVTGTGWDSAAYVLLNVSFSNGTSIGGIYPANELTNLTGGFNHTKFRTAGYPAGVYTVNVTGPQGGVNTTKTLSVTINECGV